MDWCVRACVRADGWMDGWVSGRCLGGWMDGCGQRHLNITRIAIVGRRNAENFNLKGLHRLDIKDYLFTFFIAM